ncbi:hypothetical protein PTR52_14970 [Serratia nevei]|uniref:MrpH family fimbial adhesin n=1 Tax=Serratia nevei TaxID=2703794 RepID=UPI00313EDDB2
MTGLYGVIFVLLMLMSSSLFAAQGDIDWAWNGMTLNYNIKQLDATGVGGSMNCGKNGVNCVVEMYVDYIGPNERLLWRDSVPSYVPSTGGTLQEIISIYNYEKLPKSGSISNYKNECVAIYLRDKTRLTLVGSTCNGALTPPPPPAPSPVSCDISPISLRHPPLAPEDINNNRVSANMLLTCTRQATVRIKAMAGDGSNLLKLRADGSLKSTLSVNGAAGNSGTLVTVPGPSGIGVMFTSTLIASGKVEAGNFSASGVAQISVL